MYPLALPDGEGASIPRAQWGKVGFCNEGGLLALPVPWDMAGWLREKVGDAVVRRPKARFGLAAEDMTPPPPSRRMSGLAAPERVAAEVGPKSPKARRRASGGG